MARWLAWTALALGLAAAPARAQVFKPRDGSKTTDKSTSKPAKTDKSDKSDKSEPKKVASRKPSSEHAAPKRARHARHDDPDFVKITDDDDDE